MAPGAFLVSITFMSKSLQSKELTDGVEHTAQPHGDDQACKREQSRQDENIAVPFFCTESTGIGNGDKDSVVGQAVVSSRCNGYDHVVQNFRLYPSV